eukprot:g4135.t1
MAWLKLSPEVEQALKNARPVVDAQRSNWEGLTDRAQPHALESTIISHGMPYPQNLKTAQEVEAVLRGKGVVPATIGILKGVVHVGMDAEQLEALARRGLACRKVSRRDIAQVLAQKQDGATTVSATMIFAHQAGISIFVTGGIGGVHRGDASDVSADLTELGHLGGGTPQAAELLQKQLQVQLNSGMVLAVPVPEHLSAEGKAVEEATRTAVEESVKQNIKGNEVTPFLLKRINELTQGELGKPEDWRTGRVGRAPAFPQTAGFPSDVAPRSVAEVHVLRFVSISTLTTSSAQSLEGAEESEKPPVPSTSSTPNVNAVEQNVSSTQLAESQSSSSWNGSDGLAGDTAYVVPFHFSCARRMTCPKPWEVQHRSSWLIVLLYHLNLAWLREGFTGVSERLRGWQPMNYRSPLDQSFIELGNSSATRDILQSWQRGDHLPRCNVTSEPPGPQSPGSAMLIRGAIPRSWAPNSCHLSFISPEEGAKCLTGKRILLVGDSHLRQLTRAVIEAVCGSSLDIPKRVSKCLLPDMGRCKNVQEICFLADDYLRGTLRDLANYDLIVAGDPLQLGHVDAQQPSVPPAPSVASGWRHPAPLRLQDEQDGESIRVYLRVRPATERELLLESSQVVYVDGSSVRVKSDPPRQFTFDGVMGEAATQQDWGASGNGTEEVFETVGRSVGSSCLGGYNGSVYVYGQTGAGKTHTMCGPIHSLQAMQFDERRGIICRMLDFIFAEVARRGVETTGVEHSCRCSFLEIYKDRHRERMVGTDGDRPAGTPERESASPPFRCFGVAYSSDKWATAPSRRPQLTSLILNEDVNRCGHFEAMFLQSCCGLIQEAKRSHRAQLTGRLSSRHRLSRSENRARSASSQKVTPPDDGFLLGGLASQIPMHSPHGPVPEAWYNQVTEVWTSNEDFMPFKKALQKSPSMVATGQRSAVRAAEEPRAACG